MTALADVHADLDRLCATAMPGGSRRIAVWGPKGGRGKTTVAAAILHLLGQRLVGMLAGVDANPDGGTLTERLGLTSSYVPGRLWTLARNPGAVGYLADWASFLDRVGRIHQLHNDAVPSAAVAGLSVADYSRVLGLLARYAELQIVDLGTSALHPSTVAALTGAHHIVIATSADPTALRRIGQALDELAGMGGCSLVDRLSAATLAVTRTDLRCKPADYATTVDALAPRVGHVQMIGYDKAAGAVGPIRFNKLTAGTRLGYAHVLRHALTELRRAGQPGLAAQAPVSKRSGADPDPESLVPRVGGWVPEMVLPATAASPSERAVELPARVARPTG